MKKYIKLFFVIAAILLLTNLKTVKASDEIVALDGASIRLKTETKEQGLRFYAKLNESLIENEHGFYLVYGKTTVIELEDEIVEAGSGPVIINGKEVFKVAVSGVTHDNEFSIVLLGIPEVGYFDNISVIPYVIVNGQTIFPNDFIVRSVAQVALNMGNAGEDISNIDGITTITETNKKKAGFNVDGNIEVSSGVYELNYKNLGLEFLKDWNNKFELNLANLEALAFYQSAHEGSSDTEGANKDLKETNIYKFFNDSKYSIKWGWLLDFLKSVDGTTHTSRQIDAVKGDGTNGDHLLYNGTHLSYSLTNFFNEEHEIGNFTGINFTELERYQNLHEYNDKVYVNLDKYDFYNVGESLVVPAPSIINEGYNFSNYRVGSTNYNPGSLYVIGEDAVIEAIYSPINYDVKFYDGEVEITELKTTYNIETGLILPTYSKDDYIFRGFYDNDLLEGDVVTNIPKGEIGNKTYFVKWSDSAIVKYHLGDYGYHSSTKNKDDLYEEFVSDYKSFFGRGATVETLMDNFYNNSYIPEQYEFMDIFTYSNNKYKWLKDHILLVASIEKYSHEANLLDGEQAVWRLQIEAFFKETQLNISILSLDFRMENNAHNFWKHTGYGIYEEDFIENGDLFNDVLTDSKIYKFIGFVDENDNEVTKLPASSTGLDLYAKWERGAFYVNFNIGYSASSPATQLVEKNDVIIEPTIATRPGYTFLGWFKDLEDEEPYELTEKVTNDFTLHAKWEEDDALEYNITYNLDGGKIVYNTKDELINGFLEAFYDYLELTIDINIFKHGQGKTTGYDGLWHSEHSKKIYSGARPTSVNEDYFISSSEYMNKWLPFFDMIHDFVVSVNNTQFFFGEGTSTGLLRLGQYVKDVKPANTVTEEQMKMMPEVPIEGESITKGKVGVPLILQVAYKEGKTFKGWYLNSDFSGDAVTELNRSTDDDVILYAKFE